MSTLPPSTLYPDDPGEPRQPDAPPPFVTEMIPVAKIRRQHPDVRDRTTPPYHTHRDAVMADIKIGGIKNALWVKALLDGTYQLIAGGTRLECAVLLGITHVPCRVITGKLTVAQMMSEQYLENSMRMDFADYEKMLLISKIMATTGWTATQLCKNMPGLSEGTVSKLLAMKDVCAEVAEFAKQGKLNARIVSTISRVADTGTQISLAKGYIDGLYSVAGVEAQVKKLLGKRETKASPVVAKAEGAVYQFPGEWALEKMLESVKRMEEAIKRAMKVGVAPNAIPGLLQRG